METLKRNEKYKKKQLKIWQFFLYLATGPVIIYYLKCEYVLSLNINILRTNLLKQELSPIITLDNFNVQFHIYYSLLAF